MISDLLPKSRMQKMQSVSSWEEAIKIASKPLLEDGLIEEKYVQAMIDNVEKNGPYIVLKDYFALPHAKAGYGVNQKGMSLLLLEEAVELKGNEVKTFLVLAAVDSSSHLEALTELSTLLMDDEIYKVFISEDINKINKILKKEKEN